MSTAEKVGSDRHSDKLYGTHPSFKTKLRHRKLGYLLHRNRRRPEGLRTAPEVYVFDVAPGVTPSEKPPVRIFLGTETSQHRAERIFIWSIGQVRDPARRYEIYLMKHLTGYDRRGWKTSFTNYRYAIPALAGKTGRAIYNDVDQIYKGDPAELFDIDMGGAGVLGINERETSVMLIDCERMAKIWKLEDAQTGKEGGKNHKYFRALAHDNKLWGKMSGIWNARDWEYTEGESKLLHYTTLQTQPWRPFPKELHYHDSPEGEVWFALERAADKAGYTVFTAGNPTKGYRRFLEAAREGHAGRDEAARLAALKDHGDPIAKLLVDHRGSSVLDFGVGQAGGGEASQGPGGLPALQSATLNVIDPAESEDLLGNANAYDAVVALGTLDEVPEEDVPWVLDRLFGWAEKFVYVSSSLGSTEGEAAYRDANWWREEMEGAVRRRAAQGLPKVNWVLHLQKGARRSLSDKVLRG